MKFSGMAGALNNISTSTQLFLSSYALLFALLALKISNATLDWLFGVLGALGLISALFINIEAHRRALSEINVTRIEDQGSEVAAYLLTYLLPFLTASSPTGRETAAYLAFIAVVAVVYIRSGLLQINPLLYLVGQQIFLVTDDMGRRIYLISRTRPKAESTIYPTKLSDTIYILA